MNATIAERLRDLLERRFTDLSTAWEAMIRVRLSESERSSISEEEWERESHLTGQYQFALVHYRHAYRDEALLAALWRVAEEAYPRMPKKPDWWADHRFETGCRIVRDGETMPAEIDHRFDAVRRFHHWTLDQLATGAATTSIVERYVRGVTLFDQDMYRAALKDARPPGQTSNSDERLACVRMARWLHDQGLDPFNEVQLGNGRTDVAVASGPNAVAIETKVVREGDDDATIRARMLGGIVQARAYADRLGHFTGYFVVFWLSDTVFLERCDEVRFGAGIVRVLVVDLRSKPPSDLGHVRILPVPIPVGAT